MRSIRHYVHAHGLTVEVLSGPTWSTDRHGWGHHAWQLRLRNPETGAEMEVPWMTGVRVEKTPDEYPEEVIDILVRDAWDYTALLDFGDWAEDNAEGLSASAAWDLYQRIAAQAREFIEFLGGADELEKLALTYESL
jgi:hypothetical protein